MTERYAEIRKSMEAAAAMNVHVTSITPELVLALLADNKALREALEIIEVDLTAGDMPAKTRVALTLNRVRAALASARPDPKENKT